MSLARGGLPVILPVMSQSAGRRAVENHRKRMREAGIDRFEVRAPAADKPLIREIARRLAAGDVELRREINRDLTTVNRPSEGVGEKGSVWRAFRNSPLVGAEIDLERKPWPARDIDL